MNMLNLLYEVIGLAAATATIIITLMSHIDSKINSANKETRQELNAKIDSAIKEIKEENRITIKEIKEENRSMRDYIFAYMSDRAKRES